MGTQLLAIDQIVHFGFKNSRAFHGVQQNGRNVFRNPSLALSASPVQPCVRLVQITIQQPYKRVFADLHFCPVLLTCINKMVNWHDPVLLKNDYCEYNGRCVSQYRALTIS